MRNSRIFTASAVACLALAPSLAHAQPDGSGTVGPELLWLVVVAALGGGLFTTATYLVWHHFVQPLNHKLVATLGGWMLPAVTNSVAACAGFSALFDVSSNWTFEMVLLGWTFLVTSSQVAYTMWTISLMKDDEPKTSVPRRKV